MHPNPACIYKNEQDKMVAEDEEGCQIEDYESKGLLSYTANYRCQSKNNNEKSLPVLSTVYNITKYVSEAVIARGTIVTILATRCDGIVECMGGLDEKGCGMEVDKTILAGMIHIIFVRICFSLISMYFLQSCDFFIIYISIYNWTETQENIEPAMKFAVWQYSK